MRPLASLVAKLLSFRAPTFALLALLGLGLALGVILGRALPVAVPLTMVVAEIPQQPELSRPGSPWAFPAQPDPSELAALPGPADEPATGPKRIFVPGCTAEQYQARQRELASLLAAAEQARGDQSAHQLLEELRGVLARPCLRHVTAMSRLPPDASRLTSAALADFLRALPRTMTLELDRAGVLAFLPPELELGLSADAQAHLAPRSCPADEAACGATRAYQSRAAQILEAARQIATAGRLERKEEGARPLAERPFAASLCQDDSARASFASWSACAAARVPRQMSPFPTAALGEAPRYRPVERGWIAIEWTDRDRASTAAYDVASGAFYSVVHRSEGSPAAIRQTGHVSLEALRELAFAMATQTALRARRHQGVLARVAPGVQLTAGPNQWHPSEQCGLGDTGSARLYIDTQLQGLVYFSPTSLGEISLFASLLEVVEASQVPGCAPARLPRLTELGLTSTTAGSGPAELDQLREVPCLGREQTEAVSAPPRDSLTAPGADRSTL